MKRIFLSSFLFLVLLTACTRDFYTPPPQTSGTPLPTETATLTISSPTPEATLSLRRGINIGDALEAPTEGEWGLTVQEEYFDLIKEVGFDFVRLPIRWNAHADESAPYTVDPEFFLRVDQIADWALARDMVIILDFHHYEEMAWDPWSHKDRFISIWKQIAEHYKDYPPQVMFELLNEPNDQLDAALWNEYVNETLSVLRASNSTRDVIVGPVQWNSYNWISTLDVPDDPHVIVTFHYYEPFHFTHQGADWVGEESNQWLGTIWDATDEQQAEITYAFDLVRDWAMRHHIRVLLGEFGAYSKADMASRVRWTSFVAREAERHGFAWSYWEFGSGFGIYDPEAKVWRKELLRALMP